MNHRLPLRTLIAAALLLPGVAAQEARPRVEIPERIEFNRDIRPILFENCVKCHGSDAKARKGNLRLDTKEGAFAEIEKGRVALTPRDLEKSELWKRVTTSDRDDLMPPAKSGKKLTKAEIEIVKRWIQQGAEWQGHWAFLPLQKPAPAAPRNAAWAKNPVDQYILAKLEAEGLTPSAEADRATLARRVTLDLTGLPPTPAEVDAFVKDAAPDAYEKLVDRLLASPR